MKAETQVKHLKISRDVIAVNILGIIVIGLFALICLFPFYLIIVASFTNENALIRNGFPIVFQLKNAGLEAYKLCLKAPGGYYQCLSYYGQCNNNRNMSFGPDFHNDRVCSVQKRFSVEK